ncbi:hypothetical protein [Paenibacillus sp. 1011MAR3C5]|nr:hypothetical protein [Paenibacillus sp. 1011MAR3C5]
MSERTKEDGSSLEQKAQAARNANKANGAGDSAGIDKKLNGPNRPST